MIFEPDIMKNIEKPKLIEALKKGKTGPPEELIKAVKDANLDASIVWAAACQLRTEQESATKAIQKLKNLGSSCLPSTWHTF